MGVYNTYGEKAAQIKLGDCCLRHFNIGDKVDIKDGIYIAYESIIVIKGGIFIAEFDELNTKWGDVINHPLIKK